MAKIILAHCSFVYFDICLYRHISYAHSGERYEGLMHKDRARTFLLLSLWNETLTLKTAHLATALGVGEGPGDRGYVWVMKALNYLRKTTIGNQIFAVTGDSIEKFRNIYVGKQALSVEPEVKKIRWSGRAW